MHTCQDRYTRRRHGGSKQLGYLGVALALVHGAARLHRRAAPKHVQERISWYLPRLFASYGVQQALHGTSGVEEH